MSLIGGTTKGDSNSLDGEETEFTGEERRSNGALFSDAPKEIRTPVSGLKGLRPSPLDDGGNRREFYHSVGFGSRIVNRADLAYNAC